MTIGVYGIFDKETEECLYVGLSKTIEYRWKSHVKNLKNNKHPRKEFVKWFNDNGNNVNSMDFRILEEPDEVDSVILNQLEIKWFNKLSPKFYGKVPSENEKWEHSEETKRKMSDSAIQKAILNGIVYIERICPCGMTFSLREKDPRKTCSLNCYQKYFNRMLFDNKGNSKPKVLKVCKRCNIEYDNTNAVFCSRKCESLYRTIPLDRDKLYDLYWNQEMSLHDIAVVEGVSRQTVFNRLKKFNIPRRPMNP